MANIFESSYDCDRFRGHNITIRVGEVEISAPACIAERLFDKIVAEHAEDRATDEQATYGQATMTVEGAGSYHAEVSGPAEMIERLVRSGFGSYR